MPSDLKVIVSYQVGDNLGLYLYLNTGFAALKLSMTPVHSKTRFVVVTYLLEWVHMMSKS